MVAKDPDYANKYRDSHKEKMKLWQHDWYLKNKESQDEKHRLYRLNNVEKERKRHALYLLNNPNKNRDYYLNNSDKCKSNSKEYRDNNKEYYKKYSKNYNDAHIEQIFLQRQKYRVDNFERIKIDKCNRYRNIRTDLILNFKFPDSRLHHIGFGSAIYIPVDMHLSVHHCLETWENMDIINNKVFEWVEETNESILIPLATRIS